MSGNKEKERNVKGRKKTEKEKKKNAVVAWSGKERGGKSVKATEDTLFLSLLLPFILKVHICIPDTECTMASKVPSLLQHTGTS